MSSRTVEHIRGYVTFLSKKNESASDNWRFAQVMYEGSGGLTPVNVKGTFPMLAELGEWFTFEGRFEKDKSKNARPGDEVFKFTKIRPDLPVTKQGAERLFLATFSFSHHGVDKALVKQFIDRHGEQVALLAEDNPDILLELSHNPATYGDSIRNAWAKRVAARKPLRFLKAAEVKDDVANAIIRYHKDFALEEIEKNPYGLVTIKGVTFSEVDKIGRYLKIPADDYRRVAAGLLDCISFEETKGHTFVTAGVLDTLKNERNITLEQIVSFARSGKRADETGVVIASQNGQAIIQSASMAKWEGEIARRLTQFLKRAEASNREEVDAITDRVLAQSKFAHFDSIQKNAVRLCAREPVSILTGGPGTGKSTVTEAIVEILTQISDGPVLLMAPTGKAAVRLAETTKRSDVQTVHSALLASGEEGNGEFGRNRSNPFEKGSVTIVDEASMLDTRVFAALLNAAPDNAKILLVGDRFQIPSVSPGQVFGDLINTVASNGARVPCAELINVYRSQKDSQISTGAVEVKNGTFDIGRLDDVIRGGIAFHETRSEAITKKVVEIIRKIKADRHYDPMRDVAILCPMRDYAGGTHEINRALQVELNPKGQPISFLENLEIALKGANGPAPRVGDRVIMTKNIKEKEVANGDVGTIVGAVVPGKDHNGAAVKGSVTVKFDTGRQVTFSVSEARDLHTAYAITGHKSQGSQYPCVILPMSTAHKNMYSRTLFYTMWTRAKNNLFLVGSEQAYWGHMASISGQSRNTRLPELLSKNFQELTPTKAMLECKVDLTPLKPLDDRKEASAPISAPVRPSPPRPSVATPPRPSSVPSRPPIPTNGGRVMPRPSFPGSRIPNPMLRETHVAISDNPQNTTASEVQHPSSPPRPTPSRPSAVPRPGLPVRPPSPPVKSAERLEDVDATPMKL